jgi:hypothetical protein
MTSVFVFWLTFRKFSKDFPNIKKTYYNVETDPKATKLIRSIGKSGLSIQANVAADKLWSKEDGKMDHEKYGIYADKVTEVMQLDKDSVKLRNKLASVMARPRRGRKKEQKR